MKLIHREILADILSHVESKEITLLTGARQAGKTTLMQQIANPIAGKQQRFGNKLFEAGKRCWHFSANVKKVSL